MSLVQMVTLRQLENEASVEATGQGGSDIERPSALGCGIFLERELDIPYGFPGWIGNEEQSCAGVQWWSERTLEQEVDAEGQDPDRLIESIVKTAAAGTAHRVTHRGPCLDRGCTLPGQHLEHEPQNSAPLYPEHVWNPLCEDVVLGALWGATPWEADAYLSSVSQVVGQPKGFDAGCIDPRLLPLHPVPSPYHSLPTSSPCDSQALQHQQPPLASKHARLFAAPHHKDDDLENAPSTGRFACQEKGCLWQFSSQKDLIRHCESVHGTGHVRFRCACGKLGSRKDNHKRHVGTCDRSEQTSFCCRCGTTSDQADAHLEHVARWKRRLGCPA